MPRKSKRVSGAGAKRAPARRVADPVSTKPRLDKLGVKPGQRVSISGVDDPTFDRELGTRTEHVHRGRLAKNSDIVFLGAATKQDLARLVTAIRALERNGAIWVVWPKGKPELTENDVRAKALAVDLVDVKVVAFSDQLSALKLVIPLAKR